MISAVMGKSFVITLSFAEWVARGSQILPPCSVSLPHSRSYRTKRHASIRPGIIPAIIRKRQAEEIAKEKERSVYKGSKQSIDAEKVRKLHREG